MLSRVAESVMWMSRYLERADNIGRFIDVNLMLMLDLPDMPEQHQWLPLVTTTGDEELFHERYQKPTRENVIKFLTWDREYPSSIVASLRMARENARSIREAIPTELWICVNNFHQFVNDSARQELSLDETVHFFAEIRAFSNIAIGIAESAMTHGEAWHFARMGRMLERADKTSRILDVKYFILLPSAEDVGTPLDKIQWAAVLRSASALEMYRKRSHQISPRVVADFLVLDRQFPRSIHHCLITAERSLHEITGHPEGSFGNDAEKRLGKLRSDFTYLTVDEILQEGLHEFLDRFQTRLNDVGQAINETFFAIRTVQRNGARQEQSQS